MVIAAVAGTLVAIALDNTVSASQRQIATIYPDGTTPVTPAEDDALSVELGVRFSVSVPGSVLGMKYYKSSQNTGTHTASLWSGGGGQLAEATFNQERTTGWQTVNFSQPVELTPGRTYTASYHTSTGFYAQQQWAFSDGATLGNRTIRASSGVYNYGSGGYPEDTWHDAAYYVDVLFQPSGSSGNAWSRPPSPLTTATPSSPPSSRPSPTPTTRSTSQAPQGSPPGSAPSTQTAPTATATQPATTAPPVSGSYPTVSNTGVPDGTNLTSYSGPCTITSSNTVINAKAVTCDVLIIAAPGVKITNSTLPRIQVDSNTASVDIEDSTIDGGGDQIAAVGFQNVTLRRADVTGGQASLQCSSNCVAEDSWLHGQALPAGANWHVNAFISNGGSNMTLRHNTLACDVSVNSNDGGCSGDASIFGDFAPNKNYTVDSNLFVANRGVAYCLFAGYDPKKSYGSNPSNITITNNVFQRGTNGKCGAYGPVTSYLNGLGNVWSNNKWDNGSLLQP
jgi:hypothetical protein